MIDETMCAEMMVEIAPNFRQRWEAYLKVWGNDCAGLCLRCSEFAALVIETFDQITDQERKLIFATMEKCLSDGSQDVQDAVATCFLEDIVTAVCEGEAPWQQLIPLLGTKSRDYCKAWDEFSGVRTPGLW